MNSLYVISSVFGDRNPSLISELKVYAESMDMHFINQYDDISPSLSELTSFYWQLTVSNERDPVTERMFKNITDLLTTKSVLMYGFSCCRNFLPCVPLVHVLIVPGKTYDSFNEKCEGFSGSDDKSTDELVIKRFINPFFHKVVRNSDITHIISSDFIINDIKRIITDSQNPRATHHEMYVDEPYHSLIKSGKKSVEGRKISDKWIKIRKGDTITMKCEKCDPFTVKVTHINMYLPSIGDPLNEFLKTESLDRTLPGIDNINDGRDVYLHWYTVDEIMEHGVMAINVEVD